MAIDTSAPPLPQAAGGEQARAGLRSPRLHRWLLPLLLLAVAGTLRFYRLDYPQRIYFDETYYATQANAYLTRGIEQEFAVHPPVGKWLIAAGIAATSFDSAGWRLSSAVAGTLTVLVTYLLGLRLFRRRGVAALAAFLLAVDGLAFTMSRIAMLDVFLGLFVATAAWLLLLDRDVQWAGVAALDRDPARPLPRRPHHWRWLAGVVLGLALATKWTAVLAIAGGGLFVLVSELAWRRRLTGSPWRGWWRVVFSGAATLVLVPLIVYVVSYAGWFGHFSATRPGQERCPGAPCDISALEMAHAWWGEQLEIADFHSHLEAEHQYRSQPATWLVLTRPVAYYYESCDDKKLAKGKCVTEKGNVEEILGVGNPGVWWSALLAYPVAAWWALWRRDWRAAVPLGFLLAQYLPYVLLQLLPVGTLQRPNFLFYLTPAVPFVCLTLVYALWRAAERPFLRWLPAAVAAAAVAMFVFLYPLLVGLEISLSAWRMRILFDSWI